MAYTTLDDQLTNDIVNTSPQRRAMARPRAAVAATPAGEPPGGDNPTSEPDPEPAPAPAPAPAKFAIQPVDQAKFDDPTHTSAKYSFLRTAQGFDPTKGITPELLAALNKLGYANFSGSGQHLSYGGITDAGRAAGLTNDFSGDFIQNYGDGKNANAQWAWDWADPQAGAQQQPGMTNPVTQALAARSQGGAQAAQTAMAGGQAFNSVPFDGGSGAKPIGDANAPTPVTGDPPGSTDMGNNLVKLANGQVVDRNHPLYKAAVAAAAGGAPSGNPAAPAGGGAPPVDTSLEAQIRKMMQEQADRKAQQDAFNNQIHDTVVNQIGVGNAPVDPNDPIMAAQNHAFSSQQDRALAEGREAMAARGATQGLPTGSMDAGLQSSYENLGSDKANYSANLMADRLKQKQQILQHAMDTGAGIMSGDEQRALQSSLAAMDARIKQLGLDQQERQGNRDLDIRQGGLDLGNRSETNRNNEFYDQYGANIGMNQATLQQQMMRMLMGG